MQAVVLVGGEGTRLRPLTYGTPKPMVPICGVPFLERTLSRLKEAGIDEAILAAGYLPEAITEHFGDGGRLGMRITYVVEDGAARHGRRPQERRAATSAGRSSSSTATS